MSKFGSYCKNTAAVRQPASALDSMATKYRVDSTVDRGNRLVIACEGGVKKGEYLWSEMPFVWSRQYSNNTAQEAATIRECTCEFCGVYMNANDPRVHCNSLVECSTVFCSTECAKMASDRYHKILCGKGGPGSALSTLLSLSEDGHLGCAVKVMATLLQQLRDLEPPSLDSVEQVRALIKSYLGHFHQPMYTECIHSFRGGRPMPEELWRTMFHEAYFDSHLRPALEILRSEVFPLAEVGSAFYAVCLEDGDFFERIMGMFLTNNQFVQQQLGHDDSDNSSLILRGSALYSVFAMGNHSCQHATFATGPYYRRSTLSGAPDIHARVPATGEDVEAACASASASVSPRVVGITVSATKDMQAGEEIFNNYLSAEETGLAKSGRRAALAQYLFICDCDRCEAEDSSDDDDDDDYE